MRHALFALCLLILAAPLGVPARAQTAPAQASQALQDRVRELPGILNGTGDYTAFFAPAFQTAISEAQFEATSKPLLATHGPVERVEIAQLLGPHAAELRVTYARAVATVQLAVDPAPPHQVSGLRIAGFTARTTTLDQAWAEIDALPGATGYVLARLGSGAPTILKSRNLDQGHAVGSAFKLVILAELIRSIHAGQRNWGDVVTRDNAQLPGGQYAGTKPGTRLTLRELATQMISVSDNSATDLLLNALGRDKVEAMQRTLGVSQAARNLPFLGTLEAFKLKYLDGGSYGRRYAALDVAGKRRLLAQLAPVPLVAVGNALNGKPAQIDVAEWFFSPADLVRVMDWLRRNTEGPNGAEARAVLSKNPGIGAAASRWQWVGYKGGSEPGVINMTLLLQDKRGDWYVLAGSWNDVDKPIDTNRFVALMTRAAELAAP